MIIFRPFPKSHAPQKSIPKSVICHLSEHLLPQFVSTQISIQLYTSHGVNLLQWRPIDHDSRAVVDVIYTIRSVFHGDAIELRAVMLAPCVPNASGVSIALENMRIDCTKQV
jgi:hypothetical protein